MASNSFQRDKEELVSLLQSRVLEISFVKNDGSDRTINATLQADVIPATTYSKDLSQDQIIVWSVNDNGWRTINLASIKSAVTV